MKITYDPNLTEKARQLRNNSTLSEIILWKHLKNKQMHGYKFSRQKLIGEYIVDFFCNELELAIEIDGSSHNTKVDYDKKRQGELEKLGLTIVRFQDKEVKQNILNVLRTIEVYVERFQSE